MVLPEIQILGEDITSLPQEPKALRFTRKPNTTSKELIYDNGRGDRLGVYKRVP